VQFFHPVGSPTIRHLRFTGERTCKLVILANRFAPVFALQAADREMPFREALKVPAKKNVERETADCARDGDEFRGHFLADLKTKSRSNLAYE
jgi:hypothetical protein